MPEEILSVALWEPLPEMETAALDTFRELSSIVASKGYGRDLLYRDRDHHYVFMRYWNSEGSAASPKKTQTCSAAGPAWETRSKL